MSSIEEFFLTLSQELRQFVGQIDWPDDRNTNRKSAKAMRNRTLKVISEGTVRYPSYSNYILPGYTHAWISQDEENDDITITRKDPVMELNVSSRYTVQSFKAKKHNLLYLIYFLKYYRLLQGHITTICDNEGVIRKIKRGFNKYTIRNSNSTDADL